MDAIETILRTETDGLVEYAECERNSDSATCHYAFTLKNGYVAQIYADRRESVYTLSLTSPNGANVLPAFVKSFAEFFRKETENGKALAYDGAFECHMSVFAHWLKEGKVFDDFDAFVGECINCDGLKSGLISFEHAGTNLVVN